MVIKKGAVKLGKIPKVQAIYGAGAIIFYYYNGSGISKKTLDLSQNTLSDGASTDMYYDCAAVTLLKTIALKGEEVRCF